MSEVYAILGAAAGVALWTGAVAWAVWAVAARLADAREVASAAELQLAARDVADVRAEAAELRAIITDLREGAKGLGYEGRQADADAERRLAALGQRNPDTALGLLLGAEGEDGGPPGGGLESAPPPGPTA